MICLDILTLKAAYPMLVHLVGASPEAVEACSEYFEKHLVVEVVRAGRLKTILVRCSHQHRRWWRYGTPTMKFG